MVYVTIILFDLQLGDDHYGDVYVKALEVEGINQGDDRLYSIQMYHVEAWFTTVNVF